MDMIGVLQPQHPEQPRSDIISENQSINNQSASLFDFHCELCFKDGGHAALRGLCVVVVNV